MKLERGGLPILAFPCEEQWETWLAVQSNASKGLWLKLAKQASGILSLSRQEAVDTALCHGWFDGQLGTFDRDHWCHLHLNRITTPLGAIFAFKSWNKFLLREWKKPWGEWVAGTFSANLPARE